MQPDKVVRIHSLKKPRSFTSAEYLVEEVRNQIFASGIPYQQIADKCGVGKATIARIANGHTRWPRHTTLFPLLHALHVRIQLVKD